MSFLPETTEITEDAEKIIPDPTQGIYTKFGEVEGVDELRYWYDRCTLTFGAHVI